MGFLNSSFLFALAAVSVPLILHFLSRRRITTIEFSSLRFLEQMQKSRMKWLKIKEIILLVLRMAVIALIVMAFARPTLRGFVGSSKASSSVATLIDRSASMETQGETGGLFDEARRTAARLVGGLEAGDMIALIDYPSDGAVGSLDPLNPGDRLLKRISGLEPGYGSGGPGQALKSALEFLNKSPDLNREIYIVTDGQENGWDDLPPEVMDRGNWEGINLSRIRINPSGPANVGITDIFLPPQMLVPGENFEIEAELINYGTGALENALVGLVVDNERKAQSTVSLRPGQPTRVSFKFKIDAPGKHGGFIEIDYDRYDVDNKRYFTLDMPERISLLTVGQTESSLRFLSLALNRPEAGQISFKGIGAGDLLREDLEKYDVVLLYDLKKLDPAREASITGFVDNGGGLFVSLGKSIDPVYWKTFLKNAANISAGDMTGSIGEYIVWDNFDYEHPIFSVYAGTADRSKPSIPDIHIFNYLNLQGGKIIGSSSSGVNLLAESKIKPILIYSSGLDLATGDLPAHSFFLPVLVRSMEYLGSRGAGVGQDGIIGELFTVRIGEVTEGIKLISPANDIIDINPTEGEGGAIIKFTVNGSPGIYKLATDSRTISLIAFNVDPKESSDETITTDRISELLGVKANDLKPGSDIAASVRDARFGKELWKEFLLAALILLIIESILGRTSPPKTAEKPA